MLTSSFTTLVKVEALLQEMLSRKLYTADVGTRALETLVYVSYLPSSTFLLCDFSQNFFIFIFF